MPKIFPLHPQYADTVFLGEGDLPRCFVIITAWNPLDRPWPLARNRAADRKLATALLRMGHRITRLDGCSPDLAHREPGWAVPLRPDHARRLARRFGQRAIWSVTDDRLTLVSCIAPLMLELGRFSSRIQAPPPTAGPPLRPARGSARANRKS